MKFPLDLPEDVFSIPRQAPDDFVAELRLAACVKWYEFGKISQAKAAGIQVFPAPPLSALSMPTMFLPFKRLRLSWSKSSHGDHVDRQCCVVDFLGNINRLDLLEALSLSFLKFSPAPITIPQRHGSRVPVVPRMWSPMSRSQLNTAGRACDKHLLRKE